MACEYVSARMMELLYEELPEGERAAIRAHLESDAGGCDRCRRELADLQRVRAQARQVLDADPPARAHAAIMRAAEAAAAARPSTVRAAPSPSGSWWDRFRARWTFPTLATIGAVAVFLLASKLFLEPKKTYERGRQGLAPAAPEEPATATPVAQAPAAVAPAMKESAPAAAAPKDLARAAEPSGALAPGGIVARGDLGSPDSSKGAGDLGLPTGAAPPSRRHSPAAPSPSRDRTAKPEPSEKQDAHMVHPAMRVERARKASLDDELDGSFAPPPPPRSAPPAPAAPNAPAKKKAFPIDDLEGGYGNGSGGGVQAGSATAPSTTGPRAKAAPQPPLEEEDAAPVAAPRASAPRAGHLRAADSAEQPLEDADEASAPAREDSRRNETPVARADRLFAAGRWAEAVGAYRELLQRFPKNPEAGRWRQRLAAALAALDR